MSSIFSELHRAKDNFLPLLTIVGATCFAWARKQTMKRRAFPMQVDKLQNSNFDGVGVPLRVLRKAETVLLRRTSRLTIVIERSTNSQNYTAVLRTAEALGVQHVWLISPPGWRQNNYKRKKDRFKDDDEEWHQHVA